VPLGATDAVGGVTAMDTSGFVMVRTAVPEIVPDVAVMVEVAPGVVPIASPAGLMLAPAEALHVTLDVMFFVLASA
jgi:hypothetical protein